MQLAPEAAARDQDEPIAHLGEIIGKLRGHSPTQRVAQNGRVPVPEKGEQVANTARILSEGMVRDRLCRLPMAQQIRGDDGEMVGEMRDDPVPYGRTARDAVKQDEDRSAARGAVADGVAVEVELAYGCVHFASHRPGTSIEAKRAGAMMSWACMTFSA